MCRRGHRGAWTLLRGRGVPFLDEALSNTLLQGALLYARPLAAASLGRFDLHSPFAVLMSVAALVAVIAVGVRAFARGEGRMFEGFCLGIALLLTCLVLHAPIAVQNLSGNALTDYGPSVRLFHLAIAVPFILVAFRCSILRVQSRKPFARPRCCASVFWRLLRLFRVMGLRGTGRLLRTVP